MAEVPPEAFEREQGFTAADWQRMLPGACGDCPLALGEGTARITIDGGTLQISWAALPPRRIALIAMPRLAVRYRFDGVPPEARARFLRYFDLYTQRGGG